MTQDLKLFVGDISIGTDDTHLKKYFSNFGKVQDATIMKHKTGLSRGFGFVLFNDKDVVEKVLEKELHVVNGSEVEVQKSETRERKIHVNGIQSIEDDVVKTYFKKFGNIDTYRRRRHKTTNKLNVCTITFKDDSSFERCLREKHEIYGRKLKVRRWNEGRNHRKHTETNGRKVETAKDTMIKSHEVSVDKTVESKGINSSKKVSQKNRQNKGNGNRFNLQRNDDYWKTSDDYGKPYRNVQDYVGQQGSNQDYHQGYNQNYGYRGGYDYLRNYSNQGSYGYQGNYSNPAGYGYQGGYGGYGYQQYGGYGYYYQGYMYNQGYGNFQGYGNQGGYRGHQQQGASRLIVAFYYYIEICLKYKMLPKL